MKIKKYILPVLILCSLTIIGCVDNELEQVLDYKNNYKTASDADNAVLGIYGQFMTLAEQVVVLNELRGDLVDLTPKSSKDLQEIYTNTPSKGNKYADPTQFYKVIQNCNDVLANFKIMRTANRLNANEYAERYSDIASLRCWLYLQLGIQYGSVPYITKPTVTIDDVAAIDSVKPISFDVLLDSLITEMTSLPTLDDYLNSPLVKYSLDGYTMKNYFAQKKLILGDLYMWRGRDQQDYINAATQYRKVLATDETSGVNNVKYRCSVWPTVDVFRFQILYVRYKPDDVLSLINRWKEIFSRTAEDSNSPNELIWTVSYDKSFQPTYPFIRLFGNSGKGEYQLKPSSASIQKWNSEVQTNEFPFDSRGPQSSYDVVNGDTVVQKYLYSYDATKPYAQSGRWWLYRSGQLLLRYAEAVNRAGLPKLAYAVVNTGFKAAYTWPNPGNVATNVWEQGNNITGYDHGKPYPEWAKFNARQMDVPFIRDPWRDFPGIRGRANLKVKTLPAGITTQDSIQAMEKLILDEDALECAYEGYRWGDLLRVARRMNKNGEDGTTYLNGMLNQKYKGASPYTSPEKWYLPYFSK